MLILQPQNHETCGIEELLTGLIPVSCLLAVVRRSFQLDDKAFTGAIEVDDVGADAVLTPEFPALQLRAL